MVNNPRQRATATVLIVFQLLLGGLIETEHTEGRSLKLQSKPVLALHECGANEIHIPLNRLQCCQACIYLSQRLALETSEPASTVTILTACAVVVSLSDPLLRTYLDNARKRGPPLFS